ncbi:MAG: prepilin-type N-terminal cleavage/methylation domain-containing protein [Polyangiales bacterium]
MKALDNSSRKGFTLLEVMTVVVIMGVLATLGLQTFQGFIARTRRTEAILALRALADAQQAHHTIHGEYSGSFHDLNFALDQASPVSPTELRGPYYTYVLSQPNGSDSWYCVASGNIDGDQWLDIFAIQNL